MRWEAAKSLSDIADPAAAPALVQALEDPETGVRWLAAEGLIRMRSACLQPLLHALTERADSVWLRDGAHHVLHDLAKMGLAEGMAGADRAGRHRATATVPGEARRGHWTPFDDPFAVTGVCGQDTIGVS